jgi:hypothetical protein
MDDIEVDGVLRDLRHLSSFVVTLPEKGKNDGDLKVRISLGLHTISQSCERGNRHFDDENGKPRRLCEDRYAFSLGLPELAKRMIEQNYFCWVSADRNRAIHYAVIDVAPGRVRELNDGEHQVMFFYLYPCRKVEADVNLVVTSCYAREVVFGHIKRRFNVHTILRKCLFSQKRIP